MKRLRKFSSHPKFDKERRKQSFAIVTMSSEGKKRLLLILISLLFVHSYTTFASSPSKLRGGLVYQEKTTQGPVYVNIETVTLFRKADPSILPNRLKCLEPTATAIKAFVDKSLIEWQFSTKRKISPFPRKLGMVKTLMFIHTTFTFPPSNPSFWMPHKFAKKWEEEGRR